MNFLIDTHYLLWTLFQPGKISERILGIFRDEEAVKCISVINLWQNSMKYFLGKLKLDGLNPEQVADAAIESGFQFAEMNYKTYASYYKLSKKENHNDPFDRMLIWQAIENDYTLITKDRKIEQYIKDGLKIIIGT